MVGLAASEALDAGAGAACGASAATGPLHTCHGRDADQTSFMEHEFSGLGNNSKPVGGWVLHPLLHGAPRHTQASRKEELLTMVTS